ncbi:MAG: hypothetical protein AAB875_07355 [Patescibacteria group bacterium]
MYPAQTSLIPVTVAIARFWETNGFGAFGSIYPFWYLGVAFRYLSGPVIPLLITGLKSILPNVSLFSITIYLVFFSFGLAVVGWGILATKISGNRSIGLLVSGLTLILPWRYFASLALDEASFSIARNFLPYVLTAFWVFVRQKTKIRAALTVVATSFLLLLNTSLLPILLVGISGTILAASFREGKIRNLTNHIKVSFSVLAAAVMLVTFWYTPSYWITILTNPSIGGASGFKVILRILDLLKAAIPFFLAVLAVYFSGRVKTRFTLFGLTWIFTFFFLTIFRFIGDPDFWTDWTSWFWELEVGIAFLAARPLVELFTRPKLAHILLFLGLSSSFLFSFFVYRKLGRPELISSQIPAGVASLEKLAEIAGERRVFLSGSTVFWANALYDIHQVRGGRDQVATNPDWDKAAYELREGKDTGLAEGWLNKLDISYVLVHSGASKEYYHDFRHIEKWDRLGDIVWQESGDAILKVSP